jgi:hypothetical protein
MKEIIFTYRNPRHSSTMIFATEKWTQFALSNIQLDLANRGHHDPENVKKIHYVQVLIFDFSSFVVFGCSN